MENFKIYKSNQTIETYSNRAGIFKLLVDDDDLEVFESEIAPGKSVICQPYESKDSLNVFLVLEGKLFYTNEKRYVSSGDRIVFKNLEITHHLSIIERTRLLVIRNSKHFIEQASATDSIYQLIHQIQEKDQYTEDHCNNTGNLAVQIATLLKLPETSIENLLHAGKIHDVGKISIPEEILKKPAQLTLDEFEIIKTHSANGYDIVMETTHNNEIAKIVLDHHERLDGSGYPNGLKGNEISIEARILAVVDSYDAMISSRPYKEPLSSQTAIKELQKHADTWYDRNVINTLIELLSYINSDTSIDI